MEKVTTFPEPPAEWVFLDPWWRVLHAHALCAVSNRRQDSLRKELHGLGVTVPPRCDAHAAAVHADMAAQCGSLRDALELVFLLSIVDRAAFVAKACSYTRPLRRPQLHCALTSHHDLIPWRVYLEDLDCSQDSQHQQQKWIVTLLVTLLTPTPLNERDQLFQDARTRILAEIPLCDVITRSACARLAIHMCCTHTSTFESERYATTRMAVDHAATVAVSQGYRYAFASGEIDVSVVPSLLFPPDLYLLHTSNGSQTLTVGKLTVDSTRWRSRVAYGQLLTRLNRLDGTTIANSVALVDNGDPHVFAQLCSAIPRISIEKQLQLSWAGTRNGRDAAYAMRCRRLRLRWIVFALFSQNGTGTEGPHRIVLLDFALDHHDLLDLRWFMNQRNPVPLLFSDNTENDRARTNSPPSPSIPSRVLAAKHSELVLLEPVAPGDASITLESDTWMDVVDAATDDTDYVVVLLPAFSKCRLQHQNILDVHPLCDAEQISVGIGSYASHAIQSLELRPPLRTELTSRGLATLLQWVGAPLVELSLFRLPEDNTELLTTLWTSCPLLTRLQLEAASFQMLPLLIDAYENGLCHVTNLVVRSLSITHARSNDDVLVLYAALADPSRRISHTLCDLAVSTHATFIHTRVPPTEITAIRDMLTTNTTLQYFARKCEPDVNTAYVALCAEFDCQWLPRAAEPLAMRAKCAFLSVLAVESYNSTAARSYLDKFVVTRIFALAARPIRRKVVATCK